MGATAKTEPTDKSNSPEIIKIVTPRATNAYSGYAANITIKFLELRNLSLTNEKIIIRNKVIARALISGRDNKALICFFIILIFFCNLNFYSGLIKAAVI